MAGKPRIGMIGNGNVGSALSKGLRDAGYDVQAVGKEPARVREVAEGSDVIFLAVPFSERQNAIEEMGEAVDGKTLVDVTNALGANMEFASDASRSGAEDVQQWAGSAKVVKAFNTVFAQTMSTGKAKGDTLSLLAAGDDTRARDQVLELAAAIGFDPVDAGPLENARWLEALGYFNIKLGYGLKYGPEIGFRLVGVPSRRRPATVGKAGAGQRGAERRTARSSDGRGRKPPRRTDDGSRSRSSTPAARRGTARKKA